MKITQKPFRRVVPGIAAIALCAATARAQQNYTLQAVEASSENWTTTIGSGNWIPANGVGGNLPAAEVVAQNAQNTFEVVSGARLRTPGSTVTLGGVAYTAFPGGKLTIDGTGLFQNPNIVPGGIVANGELAFKQSIGPNNNGPFNMPYETNYFPLVVLNGGDIDTRAGGVVLMTGNINVVTNNGFGLYSYIYNDGYLDRDFQIYANLSGPGGIGIINYAQATGWDPNYVEGVTILGTNNTFTGPWHVFQGALLGATTNADGSGCLGTNTITVDAAGVLETLYDINNTNGDLILNGQLFLHQNDTFHSVVVGNTPLAPGTYTFLNDGSAYDLAQFNNNIPESEGNPAVSLGTSSLPAFPQYWNGLNDSAINGDYTLPQGSGPTGPSASGISAYYLNPNGASLTVLAMNNTAVTIVTNPVDAFVLAGQTATFSAAITGPVTSIQWYSNDFVLANATNLTYTTPPVVSGNNGTLYKIIVSNPAGSANATATLHIGTQVNAPGFVTDLIWDGSQYTDLSIQTTSDSPSATAYYPSFAIPSQGENYADQISGLFIAPVTTNYVFFLSSYLNSELYLTTNGTSPSGKTMIAQENSYSNPDEWLTSAGNSTISQKQSDQFTPDNVNTPFAAGILLTAGTSYYIEADHLQTAGSAHLEVTYKFVNAPDPADGTPPAITSSMISTKAISGGSLTVTHQPTNATTVELHPATFSVSVGASGPVAETSEIEYQWQRNGVAIAGANSSQYTTPPTQYPADNGAKYNVVVTMAGVTSITSANATNTVVQDSTPPVIAEVPGTALDANANYDIGIVFDKPVTGASATNLANYHLSAGAIVSAQLFTNTGLDRAWPAVLLSATGLTAGTPCTLSVSGVADTTSLANTVAATNVSITPSQWQWAKIGVTDFYLDDTGAQTTNAVAPWAAIPVGNNGFDLVNAGQSFSLPDGETGGTEDDITFAYMPVTNNFDVVLQVQHIDSAMSLSSVGLMLRERIEAPGPTSGNAARFQSLSVTPTMDYTGTGAPTIIPHIISEARLYTVNANAGDVLNTGQSAATINEIPSPYPNVWLRMQRAVTATNDIISLFHSTNGVNWLPSGQQNMISGSDPTTDIPTNAYLGVFFSASVGTTSYGSIQDWAARVRNFGNLAVAAPQPVTIGGLNVAARRLTFSFSTQALVNYVVQSTPSLSPANWQTLTNITGTGSSASASDNVGAGTMFYRVVAQPTQ